jgi:alkaline phosphatase
MNRTALVLGAGLALSLITVGVLAQTSNRTAPLGSVVFIHPDGTGPNHWGAARMLHYGPDGNLNWDKLSNLMVYRGHMRDQLTGTSNAGAVTHAMGVKVQASSFGLDAAGQPVVALSGKPLTILEEAQAAGLATGIINSGIIQEPGSAAFVARVAQRSDFNGITKQLIEKAPDVILGGGERYFLPKGTAGRYTSAENAARTDNVNLIDLAKQKGYTVIYTRAELLALPANTRKVLGIFADEDTYNDEPEEKLREQNLPLYGAGTPTVGEMTDAALKVLSASGKRFFLVAEEEGTDNFGNANNASGTLEAAKRADDAIGIVTNFIARNPNTLLITAADSDAGGMQVQSVPANANVTAPLDGVNGTGTAPFLAQPDRQGNRYAFAIGWVSGADFAGGIVARTHGLNAGFLNSTTMDNTDVYRLMYATLFGNLLP